MTLMFRLYDDVDKGQFHCDGCGICRFCMMEYYEQWFCSTLFPASYLRISRIELIKQIGLCLRRKASKILLACYALTKRKLFVYLNCV